MYTRNHDQSGIIMILALMAISVFALAILATVSIVGSGELQKAASVSASEKTLQAAEAGADEALYRLAKNPSLTGFTVNLDGVGVSIAVTPSGFQRVLTSTATDITGKKRTIRVTADTNSFSGGFTFAVQGGSNGVLIDNATVQGDTFSNGDIIGANGATVTGDATVAGSTTILDQLWTANNGSLSFGKKINPNTPYAAQSFTPGITNTLKKVSLYLSKTNNPSDLNLSIMADNAGSPSSGTPLASGTVFSSAVTAGVFNWTDISFTAPLPSLNAGSKYWIVLQDSSNNASKVWLWAKDPTDAYTGGTGKKSANGTTWSVVTGDLDFKAIMGGVDTKIDNVNIQGNAYANTISNSSITKDAYFQTLTGSNVTGAQHPGSADPDTQEMPIQDSDIQIWTDQIDSSGSTVLSPNPANTALCPTKYKTGTYYCITTDMVLGNQKINGNLYVDGDKVVTLTGNIWVKGDIRLSGAGNGGKIQISPALGASSLIVISDGIIQIANNYAMSGSGDPKSFLLMVSKSTNITPGSTEAAVTASNNSSSIILAAPHGELYVLNNGQVRASAAEKLHLFNNSTVIFDSAISSLFIPSTQSPTVITVPNTWQEL